MKTGMKTIGLVALAAMTALPSFAQGEKQGQGQVTVTILPKKGSTAQPQLDPQQIKLKVAGKDVNVVNIVAPKDAGRIELVILIDSGLRTSIGTQLGELSDFVHRLPPNVKAAVAWMQNGQALFSSPLTTDRDAIAKGLHLPGGIPGLSASPYFCLSDLAKRWPQGDGPAKREVLMITNGVDNYNPRYDPDDPYVQAAISDSVRAGIVLYSIYWSDAGRFGRTGYANNDGQNLLTQTTAATGGRNFWTGIGNPVSFEPYLDELGKRIQNQYELSFTATIKGKADVEPLKLKLNLPDVDVTAPQQVYVGQAGMAQN